jgi:hypothetical protein
VRAREQIFWKEVSRLSSAPLSSGRHVKGAVARPLERLISAHAKLLDAKREHAGAVGEVQAGVARVEQSDAMRNKVRDLHQVLKQRCAALLTARREEELAELVAKMPQMQHGSVARRHLQGVEADPSSSMTTGARSPAAAGERPPQSLAKIEVNLHPVVVDKTPATIASTPVIGPSASVCGGVPSVQSVEIQRLDDGPHLKIQCALANGSPVTLSLTRHGSGAVSAVVESPNVCVTAQLSRERANFLAKLSSLGVPVRGLEVRRGGDASIDGGRQLRRPRWVEEGEDENSIA